MLLQMGFFLGRGRPSFKDQKFAPMTARSPLVALVLALLLSAPAYGQSPAPPTPNALRDFVESVLDRTGAPGAGPGSCA